MTTISTATEAIARLCDIDPTGHRANQIHDLLTQHFGEALKDAAFGLRKYGEHRSGCAWASMGAGACNCGLNELRNSLDAARAEKGAE